MGRAAVRWGGGSPGVSPRRVPWLGAVEHGGNDLILRACAGVNQRLARPPRAGVPTRSRATGDYPTRIVVRQYRD